MYIAIHDSLQTIAVLAIPSKEGLELLRLYTIAMELCFIKLQDLGVPCATYMTCHEVLYAVARPVVGL